MADRNFLNAVDALYDAAVTPNRWPATLEIVAQALGGFGTTMVPLGMPEGTLPVLTSDNLAEAAVDYRAYWHLHDTPHRRALARGLKPGIVGTDRINMSEEEIKHDPFYQEFWYRHGIGFGLATLASLGQGRLLSVSVQRELRRGYFQQNELDDMAQLAPHIRRAVSVSLALAEARSEFGGLTGAGEKSAVGLIALDANGKLRSINEAAAATLGETLHVTHGRVRGGNHDEDRRLQKAIREALPMNECAVGRSLALRDREGKYSLLLEVTPQRFELRAIDNLLLGPGGVMLTLRSLAHRPPHNVDQRLLALGLTPKQARIAACLADGLSVREAAEVNGVTYESARTYLRVIFGTLGVRRQAELAALVERVMAR